MIIRADARKLPLRDGIVQCCVTSPPYFGLRRYDVRGDVIGAESTLADWVANLVTCFREVRRVLRTDGALWLNVGDTYASRGGSEPTPQTGVQFKDRARGREAICRSKRLPRGEGRWGGGNASSRTLKPKDLCGAPWRLAFALQADGWYLRQDIIWAKPAPMPESVRDRCTKAHEYIFLLSKSPRYYFDQAAISEPVSLSTHLRVSQDVAAQIGSARANGGEKTNGTMKAVVRSPKVVAAGQGIKYNDSFAAATLLPVADRNCRSVWTINAKGYTGAHFATFPLELARRCILAGSRPGDIVLDPFAGSGTTGEAALKLGRQPVLCDLGYQNLQRERMGLWANAPVTQPPAASATPREGETC